MRPTIHALFVMIALGISTQNVCNDPMEVEGDQPTVSPAAFITATVAQAQLIANIDEMLAGQGTTAVAQLMRMADHIRQQQAEQESLQEHQ